MRRGSSVLTRIVCVLALLTPTAGCESITSYLSVLSPPPVVGVSLGVGSLIGLFIANNSPVEADVQKSCFLNGDQIDCSDVPGNTSKSSRSSLRP